jgi:hypothetical protein
MAYMVHMKKHIRSCRLLTLVLLGFAALPALGLSAQSSSAQSLPAQSPLTSNDLARHLPPDADKVLHINLPSLLAKVNWPVILSHLPLKSMSGSPFPEELKHLSPAGIDIRQGIFIAQSGSQSHDSTSYTLVLIPLTDSGAFLSQLRQQDTAMHMLHLPGKGGTAGKGKIGIAWNDRLAVITIAKAPKPNSPGPDVPVPSYALLSARRSLIALEGFDHSIYTTDTLFKAGFSDDADIQFWSRQGAGIPDFFKGMMHSQARIPDVLKSMKRPEGYSLSELRFQAGKINFSSKTRVSPDQAAMMAAVNTRPLNTDLLSRLPQGSLLGVAAVHVDLSALNNALEKCKDRPKIDSMMASCGLTPNDLLAAFRGDFILAALTPDKGTPDTANRKKPDLYFIATIKDTVSFRKIAAKLRSARDSISKDSTRAFPHHLLFGQMKPAATLQDNILVIAPGKRLADEYFTTTGRRATDLITDKLRNSPFGLVIDIKAITAYLNLGPQSSGKGQQLFKVLNQLNRLELTFPAPQGNYLESSLDIIMNDPSKNSLQSLLELLH